MWAIIYMQGKGRFILSNEGLQSHGIHPGIHERLVLSKEGVLFLRWITAPWEADPVPDNVNSSTDCCHLSLFMQMRPPDHQFPPLCPVILPSNSRILAGVGEHQTTCCQSFAGSLASGQALDLNSFVYAIKQVFRGQQNTSFNTLTCRQPCQ